MPEVRNLGCSMSAAPWPSMPTCWWHVLALGITMSQRDGSKTQGEEQWANSQGPCRGCRAGLSVHRALCALMDVWCSLVALLRHEAAQLCPFASTSQGRGNSRKLLLSPAAYSSTETFSKLRLKPCLSPGCPCLHAFVPTVCLSCYWNGKPELNEYLPFTRNLAAFFPYIFVFFTTSKS